MEPEARASLENTIRSFTEAEVALGEVIVAAESFRSSAALLDDARGELKASRAPVEQSVDTLGAVARDLRNAIPPFVSAATTLGSLDPERLWASITALERRVDEEAAAARRRSEAQRRRFLQVAWVAFAILLGIAAGVVSLLLQVNG